MVAKKTQPEPVATPPQPSKSKRLSHTLDSTLTIETDGLSGNVDIDDMTSIHSENIEGEILTIIPQLTKVGYIKAISEGEAKRAKLKLETYAARFNSDTRKEASANGNFFMVDGEKIKLTENSAKEALQLDKQYNALANTRIDAETNFELVSMLYWSLSAKSEKLDKLFYTLKTTK